MNCEQFKELMLTDYLDKEIGHEQKNELQDHLASCSECSEYLKTVKAHALAPFSNLEEKEVPQDIWQNIKESIEEENKKGVATDPLETWKEKLKALINIPKPAFVVSSLAVVVLMSAVLFKLPISQNGYVNLSSSDKVEVLIFLTDEYTDFGSQDGDEVDLAMEEYFL